MINHNHKIKVYYKDIDRMGIVYYSRYLEYFEEARTEMFNTMGMNVTEFEKDGIKLPVVTSHCDYKKGAKFEDDLIINSSIHKVPRSTLEIEYQVHSSDYVNLYAEGYTIHAFIKNNGKPIRVPSKLLSLILKEGIDL